MSLNCLVQSLHSVLFQIIIYAVAVANYYLPRLIKTLIKIENKGLFENNKATKNMSNYKETGKGRHRKLSFQ